MIQGDLGRGERSAPSGHWRRWVPPICSGTLPFRSSGELRAVYPAAQAGTGFTFYRNGRADASQDAGWPWPIGKSPDRLGQG